MSRLSDGLLTAVVVILVGWVGAAFGAVVAFVAHSLCSQADLEVGRGLVYEMEYKMGLPAAAEKCSLSLREPFCTFC